MSVLCVRKQNTLTYTDIVLHDVFSGFTVCARTLGKQNTAVMARHGENTIELTVPVQ